MDVFARYNWIKIVYLGKPRDSFKFYWKHLSAFPQFDQRLISYWGCDLLFWSSELNLNINFVYPDLEYLLTQSRWLPLMTCSHLFILPIEPSLNGYRIAQFLRDLAFKFTPTIPILGFINKKIIIEGNSEDAIKKEFSLTNTLVIDYDLDTQWNDVWESMKKGLRSFGLDNPIRSLKDIPNEVIPYSFPFMGHSNEFFELDEAIKLYVQNWINQNPINFHDLQNIYTYIPSIHQEIIDDFIKKFK